MNAPVLVVDDDAPVREALTQTLELEEFEVIATGSFIEAKDHIRPGFAGVILSDMRMPGRDGFYLLEYTQGVDAELPVILLTGEGDIPMAVRAMSMGAFGFLEKPCAPADLTAVISRAQKTRALVLENRALKRQVEAGDAAERLLRGTSDLAEKMRNDARAVARTGADVLITGEPGVGTARMAEVVHLLSPASRRPFLKLPAAGQSATSLTEALQRADGGTLFLDEVGALDPAAQFVLLDLLERPGAPRVLAGTYQDLAAEAQAGRFHPDLYYRLDAARIRIPPLRDRPEDIPVLFRHYVSIACEQAALSQPEITPQVVARLMARDWPGNARALMNVAMRFAMGLDEFDGEEAAEAGLTEQLARVERTLLTEALKRAGGNATEAATRLKLPRKTFYDKLTRHGLKPEDYRS